MYTCALQLVLINRTLNHTHQRKSRTYFALPYKLSCTICVICIFHVSEKINIPPPLSYAYMTCPHKHSPKKIITFLEQGRHCSSAP